MEGQALKIQSLIIFPIKSCRGISVPQATVTQTGKSEIFFFFNWSESEKRDYMHHACNDKIYIFYYEVVFVNGSKSIGYF